MKDISSTSFGYLIAFVLPGIFGLYALSRWFPELNATLQPILTPTTSIGPSFVFLAVAIGVGVCISGVRSFIFERGIFHDKKPPNYAEMDDSAIARQTAIVDHMYRYHQFYGNCSIAALILYVAWVRVGHHTCSQSIWWTFGFVAFETLLVASAWDSFIRYHNCRQPTPNAREVAK